MTTPLRRRNALRLGTALATGLGAFGAASSPVLAQSAGDPLPVVSGTQGPSFGAGAGTVITPGANALDINLNNQSRVINWQTYNIAAGNTVGYTTADTTTQFAVLNRVTGVDPGPANAGTFYRSVIDGTLSSQGNIAVWLSNPAGITFGPTGAFNGGSLVLTTLDIGDTDFLDGGSFNLAGTSVDSVSLTAGAGSVASSGSVILAAQEVSTGKDIAGTTGVALVAAQDVSFTTGIGSPVAFTIASGTTLSGVRVIGTAAVSGGAVALAAASPTAVMSTLLGTDAGTSLTATATGSGVSIGSNGAASIAGSVTSAGDYTVSGTTVTLGAPPANATQPVEQAADGAVSITSSAGPIALAGSLLLSGASGTLSGGVAGNGFDLTLDFGGTTSIDGSFTGIRDLATSGGGTTALSGTIQTSGSQTYGDAVALVGDTTVSATDATFASTISGNQALTVNASGATAFGGAVTAGSLTTDAPGTTALNGGSVFTSGTQTYNDAVTLGADTLLLSTDGVAISLNGTLDGAQALTVVTSGVSAFNGVVGGTTALTSLTTTGGGTATIGGGAVTTTGAQNYGDPLAITTDTVFTGGTGTFAGGLAGGGNDATLNFGGTTVLNEGFAGIANLSTGGGGTTAISGALTTSGTQTYNEAVALTGATTLTGTDIAFTSTVDGAQALAVNGSGTTTFAAAVGGGAALASLATDAAGTTALNGGLVLTSGAQTYGDAVTLGADLLAISTDGAAIDFAGTLDGAQALNVVTSGLTRFGGVVGGTSALVSLTTSGGGTTQVAGGAITTSGAQSFGDPVALGADTLLRGASASFAGGVTGNGFDLALDFAGTTAIDSGFTGIDDLSTTGGGITTLNGTITTGGSQAYGDDVSLAGGTVLTSSGNAAVSFAGTVDGAQALTVNTGGATTFTGAVGGTTALAALATDAGGTTALGGGSVVTSGAQTFGDAVTLGADTTLTSTGAGAVTLGGTVDGPQALTVNTAGTTTFGGAVGGTTALTSLTTDAGGGTTVRGGAVTTSGAQTYGDPLLLGADTVLTGASGSFNGVNGGGFDLILTLGGTTAIDGSFVNIDDLTSNGAGTTTLGGTISTTGSQTYAEAVTLLADTTLNAGAGITFASTVDGAQALALNTAVITTLGGAVGATTALTSLTTDAGGATAINGGSVTTTGAQAYGDLVTLGADTVLTGGSGSFNGVTGNGFDLTLTLGGTTAIDGRFTGIDDLLSNGGGTTTLSGAIATSGSQTFDEAVVLAGATTLSAGNGAAVSFASTIDSTDQTQALAVETSGTTTFGGAVGGMAALASLTTDAGGSTVLNGGAVTTLGGQTFGDAVTLGADTTLASTGSGTIDLAGPVDGARALTVNTQGLGVFRGAVGGTTALTSLTTDAGGTTQLHGGTVTTTGTQTYNDAVTLSADTTLNAGDAVTLTSTVDGAQALAVNTAATTTFGGAVGSGTALTSLSTDTPGTTALNGGSVTTSGEQTFNDAVTLGADTTLSSTGGGAITLAGTVDGAQALGVNTAGVTTFGGAVGGGTALTSLATDAGGSTFLNGGAVTTTGAQTYGDAVTLGADTTLTSTGGGTIDLAATVDGAQALTVNTQGLGILRGAVGGITALTSLTTDAGGTTQLHGGAVTTTGAQTYGDAVTLSADTTLTAGDAVTLASTVDGAQALTVNTAAATTFGGAVGGSTALASLTTDAPGTTALNGGNVTTTGAQTFNDAVTLGADTTLTSTGGGAITLAATVDGAQALAINTAGTTTFGGIVGGTTALAALATDAPGTTALNGGAVTTSGAQTYGDAVTLGADTTLTSTGGGAVTLASTVDGAQALSVNTAGITTFGGAIGGGTALTSLTTDAVGTTALNGGAATTTGAQTFNDAVTLGADTTLASTGGGAITFATTLDGAQALSVNTAGTIRFGGAVGSGTALTSLTTDAAGTTAIDGGAVTTAGAQTYNDAVTIGADTTLTSTGGSAITLGSTLDGSFAFTVNTSGTTAFLGAVGSTSPLASLTTDAGGETDLDGGSVTTTGAQSYNDAVLLGADTTLDAGGDVAFATTVDSQSATARSLTINSPATTIFGGAVGSLNRLAALTTDAPGTTRIDGGSIRTTGAQTFNDAVILGADTVLNGLGGVTARGTVDGAFGLTVQTGAADAVLSGTVGGSTPLAALTVNGMRAFVTDATVAGATSIFGAAGIRIGTVRSGSIDLDALLGDITGLAASSTASDPAFGRANLAATAGNIAIDTGGLVQLGTVSARGDVAARAGVSPTSPGGSIDASSIAAGGAVSLTARAPASPVDAAHDGDIILGSGSAGTTATLSAATGDIVITNRLVAAGDIAITAGDDIRLAGFDAQTDSGLIRSTGGDVAIDAGGSLHGIGQADNALPTTQRGIASLLSDGSLVVTSDGDARFDEVAASSSLSLDIAGSLTGSSFTSGASVGTSVPGGAIFARGTGGDVTIRTGLAGAPAADVISVNRIVVDRNVSLSADQIAVGALTTQAGTITINDTTGATSLSDNYYVGQIISFGNGNVILSGQRIAPIALVALDAGGLVEQFESGYGRTSLSAGRAITASAGRAAQLNSVQFGTTLNIDAAAVTAVVLTSDAGSADVLATTGTLSILRSFAGGGLNLTKQGGSAEIPGDELRLRAGALGNFGAVATVNSSTNARIGALNGNGSIAVSAIGDLTGLQGPSTGTSDTAFERATLGARDDLNITVGGLSQTFLTNAGLGNLSIAAGNASRDGSIDAIFVLAGKAASLVATATSPTGDSAHDGDVLVGTANVGTTLLFSNVAQGGNRGNIVVTGDIHSQDDARIDSASDVILGGATSSLRSIGVRGGRDVTTATLTASEDIGVSIGRTGNLGALDAGDDVSVSAASGLVIASATARGIGPDTRTVGFVSPTAILFPAESNAGGDIVVSSTGASFTANGALAAASDVTVTTSTSAALLGSTTATSGNVTATAGTSAQLVGDLTSGANTTVTAGTTAAVQQNVTAGGNYGVTAGTGVALGDAAARTQQANGTVTIIATTGDIAKGSGRLTVVSNADAVGTEALTLTASSGNIVLADSQLTGGSIAGRESDVVLTASGAITADDLDGDRVALGAAGDIVADTIEAGTGAADLGDLAERQSVELVSSGGSITLNSASAIGAGHDIDLRAASGLTANTLSAGGSLVGRAGNAIAIGTASAGEDVALRSNGAGITVTGATSAGDDVLLTAPGAIVTGAVTASGTGPDTRTVTFGAGALDAAYAAETNAGGDIVAGSTGASFTANGALAAASDVTVTTSTSAALLGSTTATSGSVTVNTGTSAQLVGDVTSGANTTVTAGTTAAVQQNVTAGGNYGVTAGTGVALGDAAARTQQANGTVTIIATTGDIAKGSGRLTVVSNADAVGTEALTLTASSGNIVLADSQLTGGSIAGRESDVVLTASGAITADDLDGDRVALGAAGDIVADTIEAGTGAADLGDLAERQSVELVSSGGSITLNSASAIGAGHDIDLRAASGLTANTLSAGGSLVGRAGNAIAIGTASAGEDVALRSNGAGITVTGATSAGDDVLLTAPGAIVTGAVTASGTGPDTRTVTFGAGALDAAYAAETNAGGDIVAGSTGASFTANGALAAASDVTVTTSTSAALLGSTTASAGNVTVAAGTSAQLVGDVTSGANSTVTAGTTAAVQQNVTAGGNFGVTAGTGVTLGDASARTQQANGTVTITATAGDIAKGSGRLTVVGNADRTHANNAETLTLTATAGNIALANSQLTGGSVAGRESDVRLTGRGIVAGKVDAASLTARAATGFATTEAIVAGNPTRAADPVSGASTVDIAVTGGAIGLSDVTATNTGHDILLAASGAVSAANLTAARTVTITGSPVSVSGATTATAGNIAITGGSGASLGSASANGTIGVTAGTITVGSATSGGTLNLNATGSTLSLGSATSGGDVTLAAATRATLGAVTATGRNVSLSAADADINGNITASQIAVLDRSTGTNPLRLGIEAPGTGGFALDQTEVNRLNAGTVILDAGTSGTGAAQDVQIGALALDADTGANRFEIRTTRRIDLTGTLAATGTGTRVIRIGGGAADDTRATTLRIAATASGGGRVIVPGVDLDLRADRIGAGQDSGFLASLGLTPGGTPAATDTVATGFIANGSSSLYVADAFNGGAAYTDQVLLRADSLTVRYTDYALFQNTGGSAFSAGAELASLGTPSQPALTLIGPSAATAGGFALFGTINGVPDSAAAVLGDQVLTLAQINRLTARVNGCVIGSGSGCIASTTGQPPLPPLNAFRGDIFSTQGDLSIPFDPVVGTNNESLFGDVGAFGLSDLPLQPIECEADEDGTCKPKNEEAPQ